MKLGGSFVKVEDLVECFDIVFEIRVHKKGKLKVNVTSFEKGIGFINRCNGKFGNNLNPVIRNSLKREVLVS
jgi:hypothetical protein